MSKHYRAYILELSTNDCDEKLLRLVDMSADLPAECLARESAVPDVNGIIPPGMRPITVRWGNGQTSQHFVYEERFLLRKNKGPISAFFDEIGASAGKKLVVQKIGPFEFAICELAHR